MKDVFDSTCFVFAVIVGLTLVCGCEVPVEPDDCPDGCCPRADHGPGAHATYRPGPIQRLETALQTRNYAGGSCAHASMINSLIAQGKENLAKRWRSQYSGGAGVTTIRTAGDQLGVRYAFTTAGDPAFLDWCSRTRRPACIFYFTAHAITFLGFERGDAVLIDNNRPGQEIRVPRPVFLAKWNGYGRSYGHRGGVAFAAVYTPAPPLPRQAAEAVGLAHRTSPVRRPSP